jgi:hypothetical protein
MAQRTIDELILVYAADAGLVSALADSARKHFRLKGCTLCEITHGLAGERTEWQECTVAFGVPITCYHRDDVPPPSGRWPATPCPASSRAPARR